MKREIKFRAWCERDKTMYQEIGLHPFISQDHTKADEDSPEYVPESAGKGLFTLWPNESSWPIMQYAGLKDKNGAEIYDGDFLVDKFPIDEEDLTLGYNESLLPVVWCDKQLMWCVDASFLKDGSYLTSLVEYFGDSLEIRGNIHENPELS